MNRDKILLTYIHSNAHREETDCLLSSGVSAVAYEDVQDANGRFPLLRPMSELAGKGGFLAACHYMQSVNGGPKSIGVEISPPSGSVIVLM